ncbi:GNAT family N-acetyltransferase [uncultured Alteromonas sp.]|uniref:GNAT family N-acetyltransferase n=1 Tax=uncultured Alteromonas sp. TaxID=179113 RepID=UPI0026012E88|nr:GNAT family N-acetyltransferase [uncultured Alteromonas sp.]
MLTIDVRDNYTLDEVAATLTSLESSMPSVPLFLSLFWIRPWLELCETPPLWLTCQHDGRVVSSIFLSTRGYRLPKEPFSSGWFNKTGEPKQDQIWIEYNDILALPEYRQAAINCLLDWCEKQPQQKWILEITDKAADWQHHPAFNIEVMDIPAFRVKLSDAYEDYNAFLLQCSSNSRSRIRRAMKYMQQHYGELSVKSLGAQPDPESLTRLMSLHRHRWGNTSEGSGFDNPLFVQFHQALMANKQQHTYHCELLGFYAGELCLGYTYNLLSDDTVYFYLSGIEYAEQSNRFQPGLIMHTLAIAYFARKGFKAYDFMGGDSQYKRSLSNEQYTLTAVHLLKRTWLTQLLSLIKTVTRRFR